MREREILGDSWRFLEILGDSSRGYVCVSFVEKSARRRCEWEVSFAAALLFDEEDERVSSLRNGDDGGERGGGVRAARDGAELCRAAINHRLEPQSPRHGGCGGAPHLLGVEQRAKRVRLESKRKETRRGSALFAGVLAQYESVAGVLSLSLSLSLSFERAHSLSLSTRQEAELSIFFEKPLCGSRRRLS